MIAVVRRSLSTHAVKVEVTLDFAVSGRGLYLKYPSKRKQNLYFQDIAVYFQTIKCVIVQFPHKPQFHARCAVKEFLYLRHPI